MVPEIRTLPLVEIEPRSPPGALVRSPPRNSHSPALYLRQRLWTGTGLGLAIAPLAGRSSKIMGRRKIKLSRYLLLGWYYLCSNNSRAIYETSARMYGIGSATLHMTEAKP